MLKCKMRTPHNGRETLVVGFTAKDLCALLTEGAVFIDGESLGLGKDTCLFMLWGETHREMIETLEANVPVKFPRDEAGEPLPVNA